MSRRVNSKSKKPTCKNGTAIKTGPPRGVAGNEHFILVLICSAKYCHVSIFLSIYLTKVIKHIISC